MPRFESDKGVETIVIYDIVTIPTEASADFFFFVFYFLGFFIFIF